jgi:hypothetical protein
METRLALVPDEWDTSRLPADDLRSDIADERFALAEAAPA